MHNKQNVLTLHGLIYPRWYLHDCIYLFKPLLKFTWTNYQTTFNFPHIYLRQS